MATYNNNKTFVSLTAYSCITFLLFTVLTFSGCTTTDLWRSYKPGEYVELHGDWPDLEQTLRESEVDYYCNAVLNDQQQQVCYAEKSFRFKLKEFSQVLYKTPKTVIIDSLTSIVVVAVISIDIFVGVCGLGGSACATSH